MSRKANPTIIGAFIVGALLFLMAIVAFWLPGFGESHERYQLYFDGSVKGLSVGAPVMVKGVRVGSVRNISLRMDAQTAERAAGYMVPVVVEISHRHVLPNEGSGETMADMIEQGLRAQLELDSLVTQQLFVELTFRPDTEPQFHPHLVGELPEIPTVKTGWQALQSDLVDIDLGELVVKATSTLEGVNRLVNAPELLRSIGAFERTLTSAHTLMSGLNEDREAMVSTLAEVRETLQKLDSIFDEGRALMGDTHGVVQQMHTSMASVDRLLNNLNALTDDGSPTMYRAEAAMDEVTEAAQAMRRFLEMLERRPEALLRGMK